MKKVTCAAGQYLQSVHLGWGALTRGPRYAHRLHPSWIDQAPNCARPSETNACCWSGTHSRHLQLFALADFFFLILVGRQCALALSSFPVVGLNFFSSRVLDNICSNMNFYFVFREMSEIDLSREPLQQRETRKWEDFQGEVGPYEHSSHG